VGSSIRFLDSQFTDIDVAFLERRGYVATAGYAVLDGDSENGRREIEGGSGGKPTSITSSTLFVAFGLDTDVSVQFICAGKPCLYLGNDLVASTAFVPLVSE